MTERLDDNPELLDSLERTVSQTRRPVSEGAEKWLGQPIKCLDHGFVYLVDYMGNDHSIVEAARVSYGEGTAKVSTDRGLIRYLRRHMHTTPSEMIEVKFHCKLPIFVARQWIRHRTANVNEYSARYSVVPDEYYIPEREVIALQSESNKQGRGVEAENEIKDEVIDFIKMDNDRAYNHYTHMLESGVARELARSNLAVGYYTQWYWKIDLHNLIHFLRLRLDVHAQYEIRVFARAMAKIISEAFPIAWEAFVDYELEALKFTRLEMSILRQCTSAVDLIGLAKIFIEIGLDNHRERRECIEKLVDLTVLNPQEEALFAQYSKTLNLSQKEDEDERVFLEQLGVLIY